ncbi:MAG TPA: hypothetical protein VHZ74_07590 [Bryobacteraceae bacterium]|nr:hypothetical protein [Bryobacteraceae bacterium]
MPSKLTVEILVLALCVFITLQRRIPGAQFLRKLDESVRRFSRRRVLVCMSAALLVLLVRAVLLPIWPAPKPSIYDEFSYLLQADTFAHGRVTNPPHPLWPFFESVYILQQPTYASKYPPGQGLAMAMGQWLLGNPWFGVWLSCGALAAALCWALQGWLPRGWELVGFLISLDLCLFSYWMNSYWGGAVAGIGGALVIGAYARRAGGRSAGWTFGAGTVILLLTRPYEGFLLAAPVAVALWVNTRQQRVRVWIPILTMVAAGFGWTAFYDHRVTGHALRMPYQEYFSQYESIPPLTILPVQHTKAVRHFDLEFLDTVWVRGNNQIARSRRLPGVRAGDLYQAANTIFGDPLWLLAWLGFAPVWMRARRTRLLAVCAGALVAGALIELVFYAHYAAPFTAVLLILLVQSLRYLRVWVSRNLPGGKAAGRFAITALCASLIGIGLAAEAVRVVQQRTPDRIQAKNARKRGIEEDLVARHPGKHVIFVRYTGTHSPHEEWIYNRADIDSEPVIWAQDMGAENRKLIAYYPGRTFWMFEPDSDAGFLQPYGNR